MNLDLIAGLVCGLAAMGLFALHVTSAPDRRGWRPFPAYVRRGFWVAGALMVWRAVNFFDIAGDKTPIGHINPEGMMPLVAITYVFLSLAWCEFSDQLPAHWWDRLEWLKLQSKQSPGLSVVPLAEADVLNVVRASGLPSTSPSEGAEGVVREMRRFRH